MAENASVETDEVAGSADQQITIIGLGDCANRILRKSVFHLPRGLLILRYRAIWIERPHFHSREQQRG